MATIRHETFIERSADDVWDVVSDAGSIADWFDGIEESSATGSSREVVFGGDLRLTEEIVTSDEDLRRFQYRVVEGMPVDHHLGTVDVFDIDGRAFVVYSTEVEPDDLRRQMNGVVKAGLSGLKRHLEAAD